jgi:hypothetical protein
MTTTRTAWVSFLFVERRSIIRREFPAGLGFRRPRGAQRQLRNTRSRQKSLSGFRWRFGEDDSDIDQDSFGENAYFEVVVERHAAFEIPDPPETPGG